MWLNWRWTRFMDALFEALKAIRIGKRENEKKTDHLGSSSKDEKQGVLCFPRQNNSVSATGKWQNLGDQNGPDPKTTTGGEKTLCREEQEAG